MVVVVVICADFNAIVIVNNNCVVATPTIWLLYGVKVVLNKYHNKL